ARDREDRRFARGRAQAPPDLLGRPRPRHRLLRRHRPRVAAGARGARREAREAMTSGRRDALIACGVALAGALGFGRAVRYDFVELDDRSYVVENPHVLSGPTVANLVWALTTFRQANWHPLTWWSLQVDAAIGGGSPAVFHATSLLLHATAA